MSFCAASSCICFQKASFAFAILASSPIGTELSFSPSASPPSTPPQPRLFQNHPPSRTRARFGLVPNAAERSRRNIVSEHPAAVGVVESVNLLFKELWKNRSLVFPQLRHFPQRFSPAALRYAADRKRAAKCPRFSPLGRRTRSTNHCL